MPRDEEDTRVLSRKELARHLRHQAYQRAKEQRAKDPRYLAMKEAVKVRQRALYQEVKAKRKAEAAAEKAHVKAHREQERAEARRGLDTALMKLITVTSRGSSAAN